MYDRVHSSATAQGLAVGSTLFSPILKLVEI